MKNLSSLEFQQEGTFKDLKHDFAMRYFKGKVDSPNSYFKLLEENGAYRLLFEAVERSDDFEKITEHLDDFLQTNAEFPDIRSDLDQYVKDLGTSAPALEDVIDRMEATEHSKFIKEIKTPKPQKNEIF